MEQLVLVFQQDNLLLLQYPWQQILLDPFIFVKWKNIVMTT